MVHYQKFKVLFSHMVLMSKNGWCYWYIQHVSTVIWKTCIIPWKCLFWCFSTYPNLTMPRMESDGPNISITIWFHVYRLVPFCEVDFRSSLDSKNTCTFRLSHYGDLITEKNYSQKKMVLMEISIVKLHKEFMFHKSKILYFTFLVCAYWVDLMVGKNSVSLSNA